MSADTRQERIRAMAEELAAQPQRIRALVDDIRTEAADIEEEVELPSLDRLRIYSRWLLSAADDLERELNYVRAV